jgi:hypothetical protein
MTEKKASTGKEAIEMLEVKEEKVDVKEQAQKALDTLSLARHSISGSAIARVLDENDFRVVENSLAQIINS